MSLYEEMILGKINDAQRASKLSPLILGGVGGPSGGVGGPPGGFIGYLPQRRVAYDATEAETPAVTVSGSLVDNLNHIRFRLRAVEQGMVISGFVSTFLGLGDTPDDYAGMAGSTLAVKMDESGLEFVALSSGVIPNFIGLTDTPDDYTTYSGMIVTVNDEETGLVFTSISGLLSSVSPTAITFLELTDTPDSYSGEAGNLIRVNGPEDNLEFINPYDLFPDTFLDLIDTPDDYAGNTGKFVSVNEAEDGLTFSFPPDDVPLGKWDSDVQADTLHSLTDEFDDNSISGSWFIVNPEPDKISIEENEQGLCITKIDGLPGSKIYATITKPCPTGEFSVLTKIDNIVGSSETWVTGIVVASGLAEDYANAQICFVGWLTGSEGGGREDITVWSGFESFYPENGSFTSTRLGTYYRVRYDMTNLQIDVSDNGKSWGHKYEVSLPFVPTEIGLGLHAESEIGDGSIAMFQYFRVSDSSALKQINNGKRI